MKRIDLVGQRFGRLVAIRLFSCKERRDGNGFYYRWLFKCDCGNETIAEKHHVIHGHTTSCGCRLQEIKNTIGKKSVTHIMSYTRFYKIYGDAKNRCRNPKNSAYQNYGGRGIKFLWNSFKQFKEEMYQSYIEHTRQFGEKDTSIERINNEGNYSKDNCRWTTKKNQARNTRKNIFVDFEGQSLCVAEWAEKIGLKYGTLYRRLRLGWSIDKALTTKVQ